MPGNPYFIISPTRDGVAFNSFVLIVAGANGEAAETVPNIGSPGNAVNCTNQSNLWFTIILFYSR